MMREYRKFLGLAWVIFLVVLAGCSALTLDPVAKPTPAAATSKCVGDHILHFSNKAIDAMNRDDLKQIRDHNKLIRDQGCDKP